MKGIPRGYVVLSSEVQEVRRQHFTLGHEIGHYLLPDQQDLCQPCGKTQIESWDEALARPERDANQFAAEILMPRSIIQPFLREIPRFKYIEQIAQVCDTSLTASAYRLCELSSFRVAMVWSEAFRVRWYKPSEEFVRWVRKGDLRPEAMRSTPLKEDLYPPRSNLCPPLLGYSRRASSRMRASLNTPYRCRIMTEFSPCF